MTSSNQMNELIRGRRGRRQATDQTAPGDTAAATDTAPTIPDLLQQMQDTLGQLVVQTQAMADQAAEQAAAK